MAGKPKRTKAVVIAAVRAARGKMYLAAADLGVTYQTLRNYANRWPEVQQAVKDAKGKQLDTAEGKLYDAVDAGDVNAIKFLLLTQGRNRGYVVRREHRIGADPKAPPIQRPAIKVDGLVVEIDSLPLETRKGLLAACRARQQLNGTVAPALPDPETNGYHPS